MLNTTAMVHSADLSLNPSLFLSASGAKQTSHDVSPPANKAESVLPTRASAPERNRGKASSEQELLDRALEGHADSFGELIQRHYKSCVQRATAILRNRHDAEDEVQNACLRAFEHLTQFRGAASFGAWFWRIVQNQCLMRLRESRKATFLHLDDTSGSDLGFELVEQRRDPEDALGEREVAGVVMQEVSRTPAILRDVMILADLKGRSLQDVASSLGVSIPAMKSRLCRARKELRARMSKHCGRRSHGTLMQRSTYGQLAFTAHRT